MDKTELEKIRNRITNPILQNAKYWLDRHPRSLEDRNIYVDAVWDALSTVFTQGSQVNHTVDRQEQFFFIEKG
jgi:hypothetical protein